jgi:hypothetical protein
VATERTVNFEPLFRADAVRDGTGKAEAAKQQDAGISLKQCSEKMSGRKRLAYGTRKIGMAPAETLGQVKRKRKSQLCDDHHRFENGAGFECSSVGERRMAVGNVLGDCGLSA